MNRITGILTLSSVAILSIALAACSTDAVPAVTPTTAPTIEPTQAAPTQTVEPTVITLPATSTPTVVPTTAPAITPTLPASTPVPPTQVPPTSTPTPEPTQVVYPTEFSFEDNFVSDAEGWIVGFADLPANWTDDLYELDSAYGQMPDGLEGAGIYIQGHNRSDDLFMYLTKKVTGLKPNTNYEVQIAIDLASNVPGGMMGIGGSPGDSVYVKAGASTNEPTISEDRIEHLRISIDKGNQASHGSEMFSIGNVTNYNVIDSEYQLKTIENTGRTVTISTGDGGQLWVTVGTDSGFEGLSAFYYSAIRYTLTMTE